MNGTIRKLGRGLAGIGIAALSALGANGLLGALRADPVDAEVPAAVLQRDWVLQTAGDYVFESPWPLEPVEMKLPEEVKYNVASTSAYYEEDDGLVVSAHHHRFTPYTGFSLDGAARGVKQQMLTVPGTVSIDFNYERTQFKGNSAAEYTAVAARKQGKPLCFHGLITRRRDDLFQLQLGHRLDQPNGDAAWEKLRASARPAQD